MIFGLKQHPHGSENGVYTSYASYGYFKWASYDNDVGISGQDGCGGRGPSGFEECWESTVSPWGPGRRRDDGQIVVCLKIVYPYTQWFCWSLSLLFMAISLGVYPIFRHTHSDWFEILPEIGWTVQVGEWLDLVMICHDPSGKAKCRAFKGLHLAALQNQASSFVDSSCSVFVRWLSMKVCEPTSTGSGGRPWKASHCRFRGAIGQIGQMQQTHFPVAWLRQVTVVFYQTGLCVPIFGMIFTKG